MSDLNRPDDDLEGVDPVASSEERIQEEVGAPPPLIDADEADARQGAAVWGGSAPVD